jgi:hypothetical protein
MATGAKCETPMAKRPRFLVPTLLILAGAVLVIARLVLPYQAGLIPGGKIEVIYAICRGGTGSPHPSLHSCNEAAAWMAGLNVVALVGCGLAAFGVYLAWRLRQSDALHQQ